MKKKCVMVFGLSGATFSRSWPLEFVTVATAAADIAAAAAAAAD